MPEECLLLDRSGTTLTPETRECHVRVIHEDVKVYTGSGIQRKSLDEKEYAYHLHKGIWMRILLGYRL